MPQQYKRVEPHAANIQALAYLVEDALRKGMLTLSFHPPLTLPYETTNQTNHTKIRIQGEKKQSVQFITDKGTITVLYVTPPPYPFLTALA
jgi:hypothetical protein